MAFQRQKRLTRKDRQALHGVGPQPPTSRATNFAAQGIELEPGLNDQSHVHCVACGRHLDTVGELRARGGAPRPGGTAWTTIRCAHGSVWQACAACVPQARVLLADHDRSGAEVRAAAVWH
ncbi:MAG: hypothetical protein Q8S73_21670 [Deltaproteobacteria bacterium]|nr:hypothetical protein [Myxococcales bacterium]MDP3216734.1 hypothetical protein [Deltaproteobacteria bacterium]